MKEFKIVSAEKSGRTAADMLADLAASVEESRNQSRPADYWAGRLAAMHESVETRHAEVAPVDQNLDLPETDPRLRLIELRQQIADEPR